MSSNIINVLAAKRHIEENWEFILDYLRYKRLEPQLFQVDPVCIKNEADYKNIAIKYINRTSHDSYVPGSRYLYREEQIWEAIFTTKVLMADKMLKEKDNVLDIGCENSFLPLFLAFQFPVSVLGLDLFDRNYGVWFVDNILKYTRNGILQLNSNIENVPKRGKVAYIQGDATNMWKLTSNTFNIITCISTIEHIPDDTKAMKEMYRVLKPGGKILLTYPIDEEYSQARDVPDEKSWDIDRIYDIESIYKRLIEPTGLKIYDELHYDYNDKNRYKFIYNEDKTFYVASLILTK